MLCPGITFITCDIYQDHITRRVIKHAFKTAASNDISHCHMLLNRVQKVQKQEFDLEFDIMSHPTLTIGYRILLVRPYIRLLL